MQAQAICPLLCKHIRVVKRDYSEDEERRAHSKALFENCPLEFDKIFFRLVVTQFTDESLGI